MGISLFYYKANFNIESEKRGLLKTTISHYELELLLDVKPVEVNFALQDGKTEFAASDIFDQIAFSGKFSEREKYTYYSFFAKLFWNTYGKEEKKYIEYSEDNDLKVYGIYRNFDEDVVDGLIEFEDNAYVWPSLYKARSPAVLESAIEQARKIDYKRIEQIADDDPYIWKRWCNRISNVVEFKSYVQTWLSLYEYCLIDKKGLIIEY